MQPPSLPPLAKLDHEISANRSDCRIVLDHDYRVVEIAQMTQHREQPARVGGVQSHRRLIERVEEGVPTKAGCRCALAEMNPAAPRHRKACAPGGSRVR